MHTIMVRAKRRIYTMHPHPQRVHKTAVERGLKQQEKAKVKRQRNAEANKMRKKTTNTHTTDHGVS